MGSLLAAIHRRHRRAIDHTRTVGMGLLIERF